MARWSPMWTQRPCRQGAGPQYQPALVLLLWRRVRLTRWSGWAAFWGAQPAPARPECQGAPQIHHDKHHTTYVNNLNAALEKFPELQELGIVDLNKAVGSSKIPSDIATKVRSV